MSILQLGLFGLLIWWIAYYVWRGIEADSGTSYCDMCNIHHPITDKYCTRCGSFMALPTPPKTPQKYDKALCILGGVLVLFLILPFLGYLVVIVAAVVGIVVILKHCGTQTTQPPSP